MSHDQPASMPISQVVTAIVIAGSMLALMIVINPITYTKDDRVQVMVSILPQAEFVEAIGGKHVSVTVMVPPGRDPHTYAPKPSQMVNLERTKLYFKVGSPLEFELTWMSRFVELNPDMLVVDGSQDIKLISMDGSNGGLMDPHIWLSPKNAELMVQNLCNGLQKVDPRNASDYENNMIIYLQRLDKLDTNVSETLAPLRNRNLLVFHPAWGYFAKEYGMTQRAIQPEGKDPSALGLAEIVNFAKQYNVSVIFAEPQFSTRLADSVAQEIDGAVVIVDDLAKDYVNNLQSVANKIAEELSAHG